ncbi:MAG: hypothetical protein WDK95_10435 [Syntrophorhabdaceae bacterium]|jgi:hypothetical protein
MQSVTEGYGKIIVLMDTFVPMREMVYFQRIVKVLVDNYPCVKLYRMYQERNRGSERKKLTVDIDEFLDLSWDSDKKKLFGERYYGHACIEDILTIKECVPKIFLTHGLMALYGELLDKSINKIKEEWIFAYTQSFPGIIWNADKDNAVDISRLNPSEFLKLVNKMFSVHIQESEKHKFFIL